MEHVINFLDLYEKLKEILPCRELLIISLIILMGVASTYFKFKSKLHTRYMLPGLLSTLVLVIALNLVFSSFLVNFSWLRILISGFATISIVELFYSIKHPLLLSAIRLKKCSAVIEKREVFEAGKIKLFEKRPWYMMTPVERFLFGHTCYQFFSDRDDYKNAYHSLIDIRENKLFDYERKKLYLMQMSSCANLGALKKAEAIYSKISDTERDTECFLVKSIVEEYKGDMVAAAEYLQQALDAKSEITPVPVQVVLLNNFGRIRKLEENYTEATYYYQKCLELTSLKTTKGLRHVAYQNLIATLHGNSAEPNGKAKAEKYFNEYVKEFDGSTVYDLLEIEKFRLMFYRQFKTTNDIISIIEEGFKKLKERAIKESSEMLYNILASNFRLYTDIRMDPTEIMCDLRDNWEQFFKLKMPERYFLLKEIHIGMKMLNPDGFGREYQKEFNEVEQYMTNRAFDDITETLNKTSEYEIHARAMLMKERAGCVKDYVKPYNFNNVYQLLNEVINVYELNGLITETVLLRLDIADECFSIYNMDDGKIKYADVMNEQVNVVIQQLETFKKHIVGPEIELRIAAYCLALRRRNEAKLYYMRFKKQRVSPMHFKDWMRNYYANLEREFFEVANDIL